MNNDREIRIKEQNERMEINKPKDDLFVSALIVTLFSNTKLRRSKV
jgi:hypothetical protein